MEIKNIEPLQTILQISKDKKETLLYFLSLDVKKRVIDCELEEKDFYINDRVFCIKRNTLELDAVGKIICIDDETLGIKCHNMNKYINSKKYYIFIKLKKEIQSQREIFKKLLESL